MTQIKKIQQTIKNHQLKMWGMGYPDNEKIIEQQNLFKKIEKLYAKQVSDERHHIFLTIPVADRPQHLDSCLKSVLALCDDYHYGLKISGQYQKVTVIIADDSDSGSCVAQHQNLVEKYQLLGLDVQYFGLEQQQHLLTGLAAMLSTEQQQSLWPILGDNMEKCPSHKGASIMRNIVYLKLQQLSQLHEKCLFYFVDSDQEFTVQSHNEENASLNAMNYFYYLDQVFSENNIQMLTGKVVGDPPVSPAVMVGNFLEDVIVFIRQILPLSADHDCLFHGISESVEHDAIYHDMADLFGFTSTKTHYQYPCPLEVRHCLQATFEAFAHRLQGFFYGQHPTRVTTYQFQEPIESMQSARTVYTGNYVLSTEALQYFIPFAALKLRMAGPVLGRIVQAELGEQFVSVHLPMLHKRTLEQTSQSEFRSGVEQTAKMIDLSNEFERQFFGDVMLFSMQQLIDMGYPGKNVSMNKMTQIVQSVYQELFFNYEKKQQQVQNNLEILDDLFNQSNGWWHEVFALKPACEQFKIFIENLQFNFGKKSKGLALVQTQKVRNKRCAEIVDGLSEYKNNRDAWSEVLEKMMAQ